MKTLLIGYDLIKPGKDYSKLIDHLKGYGTYWHNLDSTWFIRTTKTAAELRTELKHYIDANDRVLVAEVTGADWASYGLSTKANDWLKNYL
jgi:RNAse (barnase) inhibitor barstar